MNQADPDAMQRIDPRLKSSGDVQRMFEARRLWFFELMNPVCSGLGGSLTPPALGAPAGLLW